MALEVANLHPDEVVQVDLIPLEWRQLAEWGEQVPPAPQLGAVTVLELLELDDQPFLEWPGLGDGQRRSLFLAHHIVNDRQIAAMGARKNATAGRENHLRLVGERLDHHLSANSLCLADQPDDRVFGLGHWGLGRSRRRLLRPTS